MDIIKKIIIGIVQGITEFLPVSSSGHIRIFKEIFALSEDGLVFDVLLHMGTLIAVCVFYHKDVVQLMKELFAFIRDIFSFGKRNPFCIENPQRRLFIMIMITTIPTALAGIFLDDIVENVFSSLIFVGISLMITAFLLIAADKITCQYNKDETEIMKKDAFMVGLCQACAIVPGISRSGATVFAGKASGFNMEVAVKYSFLCSLPAIIGAIVFKFKDIAKLSLDINQIAGYVAAFVASAVTGYLSLGLIDVVAKKNKLSVFAYYCIAVGIGCILYCVL